MSKTKTNNWEDFTLVIAGKEIKGISAITYDETIHTEPIQLPVTKYTATIELSKSDYEMLIEATAKKCGNFGKSLNKYGYCVGRGGCDLDTSNM